MVRWFGDMLIDAGEAVKRRRRWEGLTFTSNAPTWWELMEEYEKCKRRLARTEEALIQARRGWDDFRIAHELCIIQTEDEE